MLEEQAGAVFSTPFDLVRNVLMQGGLPCEEDADNIFSAINFKEQDVSMTFYSPSSSEMLDVYCSVPIAEYAEDAHVELLCFLEKVNRELGLGYLRLEKDWLVFRHSFLLDGAALLSSDQLVSAMEAGAQYCVLYGPLCTFLCKRQGSVEQAFELSEIPTEGTAQ